MKPIFLSVLVLAFMSTTAVYANGGKKKAKAKAKIECTKAASTEKKNSKNCCICPIKPGCEKICN